MQSMYSSPVPKMIFSRSLVDVNDAGLLSSADCMSINCDISLGEMGTEHTGTHTPSSSSSCHPSHRTQPVRHRSNPNSGRRPRWLRPANHRWFVVRRRRQRLLCCLGWLLPSDHRFESIDRVGWLGFGRAIYICGPLLPHFVQTIKMATTLNISKKRKFVADGVFYSEVNEVIQVTVDRFGCSLTGLGG